MTDSELHEISSRVITRTYPKNTTIIHEGEKSESLYIIQSGKVKIIINDDEGNEFIIDLLGPNKYFGELALLDHGPRSATIVTIEPTVLSVIQNKDFSECLSNSPSMSINLMKSMTTRIRELTDKIRSLALVDVRGRVIDTIMRLAIIKDNKLVVAEKLTHQEIANMVGASREMVTKILNDLTEKKYISIKNREIIIHKKPPLDL
ncbi:MAG: Crp/Fnr family transcriptional regulator [Gammaproteobacteria bacterium]|nr:Crp/Fnr family transcriptional regulator [Gammaproteobacteria bacterium]